MEKEVRKIDNQLNAVAESRKIEGYAIVFNSKSELLNNSFYEIIDPHALDGGVIQRSDCFALLNHDFNKGVLARSKDGAGTLLLSVDNIGLKYSFVAPETDLGNSTIEAIKRGDISASSFVFTVEKDKKEIQPDGTIIRTILQIQQLYDISPCYQPAYEATSAEYIRMLNNNEMIEEKIEPVDPKEETEKRDTKEPIIEPVNEIQPIQEPEPIIEPIEEIQPIQEPEQCSLTDDVVAEITDDVIAEIADELVENDDDEIEQNSCEKKRSIEVDEKIELEQRNLENNNNKIIKQKRMEDFKLISAINAIATKRSLSEEQTAFIEAGKAEMRKSGQMVAGDIYIPMEKRAINVTGGAGFGGENVGETLAPLTMALQPNLVLVQAGAKFITGLVNDFALPSYSSTSSLWAGETSAATDGTGVFSQQVMKPKRLTTFVDVSLQFLAQDSNGANEQLIASLQESISQKLEKTILGNIAGTSTMPAGIFVNVPAAITGVTYQNITALESQIEDLNVTNYSFIVANKAKSILKSTVKNQMSFVYDGGEIDGYKTLSSGNVFNKGIIAANFNDLWVGQWGSVVLTIDNLTQMTNGNVRIIINAFYDAAWVRPSYVVAQLA